MTTAGYSSILLDILGAQALQQADALLTRDRGFYREYFKPLRVVAPGAPLQ